MYTQCSFLVYILNEKMHILWTSSRNPFLHCDQLYLKELKREKILLFSYLAFTESKYIMYLLNYSLYFLHIAEFSPLYTH